MLWLLALLDQSEPNVELSYFVKEKRGKGWVGGNDVVNEVHEHNEHNNTCKLDENGKEIFNPRATCVVTVACCWDYRTYPVEGKNV